uniref:Uncharacterized protein n=1 Tax=viral metagenome TaxID=1070528 RepID=A0A6C0C4L8_9ZZZZ
MSTIFTENIAKTPFTTTKKILSRIKKGSAWMKVNNWLSMAQLITFVGVIIFVISTTSGQTDGELAAYYWMAVGVVTTIFSTTIMLSKTSKNENVFSLITKMGTLYTPTLATLIPIGAMIFILHTIKNTIRKDAEHLPPQFYTFHYLTFFFLFLQIIMLYQFFGGEIKSILSGGAISDPYKWTFVSAFIFFSIISLGSAVELYVIVTRFITDG